ncbi:MAG: glucose-6-phosphate isomerase, partial [Bacillota bacterium]|nr:glucose-6-phosphate isomerase [Bacillota bacterium]
MEPMKKYLDKEWQKKMSLSLDYSCMLKETIGGNGIGLDELSGLSGRLEAAHEAVEQGRSRMEWRDLPYIPAGEIEAILSFAADVRKNCSSFVVLGIGGSALGPIAVHQALKHLHYNELPEKARGGPRLYVEDNIDPERMAALMDVIDIEKAMFNVVSKSGTTAETMAQFLIITCVLKEKLGKRWKEHIVITTDPVKGCLRKLVQEEGFASFP